MAADLICELVKYFGKDWLVRSLRKVHAKSRSKGQLPSPAETLAKIRTPQVVGMFWEAERELFPFFRKQRGTISITHELTQIFLLARDLHLLMGELPNSFLKRLKWHDSFLTARQELFVAGAHKVLGGVVSFQEWQDSKRGRLYDLHVKTKSGHHASIECKLRIGRDDERTATHNVLAEFAPKMIQVLEADKLSFAVLISPNVTPIAGDLVGCVQEICSAIMAGKDGISVCNGKYMIELKKLCEPGGGIFQQTVDEINAKFSFAMKTGSPPSSNLLVIPRYYKYYEPVIVGISLGRLQAESRDPLAGPLSSANEQLSLREDGLGLVFYQENTFDKQVFERNLRRIEGHAYPNIDAIVIYAKEEGVTPSPIRGHLMPVIKFSSRVWINPTAKGKLEGVAGLAEITDTVEPYISSLKFEASRGDIDCLRKLYTEAGLL